MIKNKNNQIHKAQYLSELAILLAIVILALTGMQSYMRRGMQAKLKAGIDAGVELGHSNLDSLRFPTSQGGVSGNITNLTQYEPYYVDETAMFNAQSAEKELVAPQTDKKVKITQQTHTRSGVKSKSKTSFDRTMDKEWE